MNTFDLIWHDDSLRHDTGAGLGDAVDGPWAALMEVPELRYENDVRVRNMRSVLLRGPLAGHLREVAGRHATVDELLLVHTPDHVEAMEALCAAGGGLAAPSTPVVAASWPAALASAGSAILATDRVLDGATNVAYALVRPPGHHAQPSQADGYCLFNNVAIAAEHARRRGCERVAVIDWDVHHGNGTQACFWERGDVLAVSLHQRHGSWGTSHPQTGESLETGMFGGVGTTVNIPLPPGTGDSGYLRAMRRIVVPVVDQFRPDLILVACGQDASCFDPNARQNLTMDGFRALGGIARDLAERHSGGRLVLVQEGGYARTYAGLCQHAKMEGVLGLEPALDDPNAFWPDDPEHARTALGMAAAAIGRHWRLPDLT